MLPKLWAGFDTLVNNVLLPMAAKHCVIFTDLRFGHDVMGNIMACLPEDNKDKSVVDMQLIDFDSVL